MLFWGHSCNHLVVYINTQIWLIGSSEKLSSLHLWPRRHSCLHIQGQGAFGSGSLTTIREARVLVWDLCISALETTLQICLSLKWSLAQVVTFSWFGPGGSVRLCWVVSARSSQLLSSAVTTAEMLTCQGEEQPDLIITYWFMHFPHGACFLLAQEKHKSPHADSPIENGDDITEENTTKVLCSASFWSDVIGL